MKCPKCGQEAVGNFCSNCGTPLVNDTVRREQETVGRKQENSYDDGDSEQRNPARMESDEKKAESGSGSKRNSQEKRSSQSQDAQKREEERRDNERANPRHRRMPAVTVKRHRADDRTRDVLLPARKRISGMQNSRSRWKNAFMLWSRSGSAQSVRKTGWSAATSGNWNASPGRQSAPDGRRSAVRRIRRVTQMTVRPCWM